MTDAINPTDGEGRPFQRRPRQRPAGLARTFAAVRLAASLSVDFASPSLKIDSHAFEFGGGCRRT